MMPDWEYKKCPKCGEWGWSSHRCAPIWFVRPKDYDRSDESTVYANSAEEAANNFLSDRFANYDFPRSMTVIVVNLEGTEQYTVEISVQAVPEFSAEIVKTGPVEVEEL